MPRLFDSHCHVNFNAFKDDGDKIIRRALNNGIGLINVGSQYDTSRRALEIAGQYAAGVYAAIGIHPVHLSQTEVDEEEIHFKTREEKFDEQKYQLLIDQDINHKIVAVGEIGLDYYHESTENTKITKAQKTQKTLDILKEVQRQEFIKQLNFANKNNLPVILHCRGTPGSTSDAYSDMLEILTDFGRDAARSRDAAVLRLYNTKISGVIHCFGASLDIAQQFLDRGFYLGFTGILTFGSNANNLRQVAKEVPLDKILVETDAPYLAPAPHRGERNEPSYVEFVARKLAEIKNISLEDVCAQTTANVKSLFGIK